MWNGQKICKVRLWTDVCIDQMNGAFPQHKKGIYSNKVVVFPVLYRPQSVEKMSFFYHKGLLCMSCVHAAHLSPNSLQSPWIMKQNVWWQRYSFDYNLQASLTQQSPIVLTVHFVLLHLCIQPVISQKLTSHLFVVRNWENDYEAVKPHQ